MADDMISTLANQADRIAELEAELDQMVGVASDCQGENELLRHLLITALPYLECAVTDPHYKLGAVSPLLGRIRAVVNGLPIDGTCVRCGAVPRNASGLCATCVDEDAERAGEIQSQELWRQALDAERVLANGNGGLANANPKGPDNEQA